jgi:opacity protein-like surface antigen
MLGLCVYAGLALSIVSNAQAAEVVYPVPPTVPAGVAELDPAPLGAS